MTHIEHLFFRFRTKSSIPAEFHDAILDYDFKRQPKKNRIQKFLKMMSIFFFASTWVSGKALGVSLSLPVNGCTIYNPRLLAHFDACAEFSAVTGRGACVKVKGVCPLCVTYLGDHLQMWLPDTVIEVTPHFGRSAFAESPSSLGLAAHLKAASAWATSASGQVPLLGDGAGMNSSHASFWHVRVLPVPYGKLATTFPPLAASKGAGIPTCFSAISELEIGQWTYGLADAPVAAAIAPFALPACYTTLGAIGNAVAGTVSGAVTSVTGFDDSGSSSGFPSGCARPISVKEGLFKSMNPSSDAWSPSKLCIGTLGSLIPRTGLITANDPFKAALIASVKFQSLTGDHFGDKDFGGWGSSDKWQLVYPPSPHGYCFRPGQFSQALEMPAGVIEDMGSRVVDNATPSALSGVYIFLVWRRRDTCQEPANVVSGGLAWNADYQLNKAKNLALCSAARVIP